MTACDVCERAVRTVRHDFVVGDPSGPAAWTIVAPMYFRASDDGRTVARSYCGAACSTADRQDRAFACAA